MRLPWKPKPVKLTLMNGIGWECDSITLMPGQTVEFTTSVTFNVCDRGFGSEDGVHRLISKTYTIPGKIRRDA